MAAKAGRDQSGVGLPYISFTTLLGLLQRMSESGVPARLDPSFLENYSGGYRPTVLSSLRAAGLILDGGQPTDTLTEMVAADEPELRRLVGDLLRTHYQFVFALETNATQDQLEQTFTDAGVKGDTRRKAIAFFLKAAEFAKIEISHLWRVPRVVTAPPRRNVNRSKNAPPGTDQSQAGGDTVEGTAASRNFGYSASAVHLGRIPPSILGLLGRLPDDGDTWTQKERRRFVVALEALFDVFYPGDESEGSADTSRNAHDPDG